MKIISYPDKKDWLGMTKRPVKPVYQLNNIVQEIFAAVKQKGDLAIREYTLQFDQANVDQIKVSEKEITHGSNQISNHLKDAILLAKKNIETFHASQKENKELIETIKGVTCWRESRPIEKVGIYIPGGSAPLFSTVLMLGIPAMLAGCKEIILSTPPDRDGNINPAILFTANLLGIHSIFKMGGIQAIAAMTFGTECVPKVDKIFGPGNQFVTAAKQEAQKYIAIDMPAGPSEVLIIADETCIPEFVAADLLSQAEHGADSQVIILSTDKIIIEKILLSLNTQLKFLPRNQTAQQAIENSLAITLKTRDDCVAFSNMYAPEHLILAIANASDVIPEICNAGSVFLGNFSCESAGDYASGPNHTLPTNGFARSYSGVSLDSFIKKITFQQISKSGIKLLGPTIEIMAEAENLIAHKNAVSIRLKYLQND